MSIRRLLILLLLTATAFAVASPSPDHHEFEASLYVPFKGENSGARDFNLSFNYIDAVEPTTVVWRIEIFAKGGSLVRSMVGENRLFRQPVNIPVTWDGLNDQNETLANGFYVARMTASAGVPSAVRSNGTTQRERVRETLARDDDAIEQEWELVIGDAPSVAMPEFLALPNSKTIGKSKSANGGLPFTVYYGNLHTQSNDSDGGGDVASCSGSQPAQSGAFGPSTGFEYARNRGLDFSAATEHNHYFDGSSSTNTAADPAVARARYQAGLAAATSSSAANPGWLALYGMEWGVISNGGHMNIFGSNELFAWEYNSSNALIGDVFTPKSSYPAIYATMQQRQLVGQFNHASSSGQFLVNGTALGYDAAGDEVMVLAEIQNTSAFSNNITETETGRSSYESAFKLLLERGFHVAPSTNQDNHCANWGASWTNRTAVLIPNGQPISTSSFTEALRARRVFASSDKNSQLVFTANGRLMGERFSNSGPLTLVTNFANSQGRTVAQVQVFEGVPKRNGTVTVLATVPSYTFTPSAGEHFYYAKITQDDGKLLWSAPLWVTQTQENDPLFANGFE